MKLCEFIRPASLSAARDNLRELGPKGMILAGGTALHFMQDHTPVTAVDITRLGLSYIKQEGNFYDIGATTPLAECMPLGVQIDTASTLGSASIFSRSV